MTPFYKIINFYPLWCVVLIIGWSSFWFNIMMSSFSAYRIYTILPMSCIDVKMISAYCHLGTQHGCGWNQTQRSEVQSQVCCRQFYSTLHLHCRHVLTFSLQHCLWPLCLPGMCNFWRDCASLACMGLDPSTFTVPILLYSFAKRKVSKTVSIGQQAPNLEVFKYSLSQEISLLGRASSQHALLRIKLIFQICQIPCNTNRPLAL